MRNGNFYDNEIRRGIPPFCSYPTYEEWKLKCNFMWDYFRIFVLILPMRNGNLVRSVHTLPFLIVLILPMRNGNSSSLLYTSELLNHVLILPMRNGNSISNLPSTRTRSVLILPMRNGNLRH